MAVNSAGSCWTVGGEVGQKVVRIAPRIPKHSVSLSWIDWVGRTHAIVSCHSCRVFFASGCFVRRRFLCHCCPASDVTLRCCPPLFPSACALFSCETTPGSPGSLGFHVAVKLYFRKLVSRFSDSGPISGRISGKLNWFRHFVVFRLRLSVKTNGSRRGDDCSVRVAYTFRCACSAARWLRIWVSGPVVGLAGSMFHFLVPCTGTRSSPDRLHKHIV